MDSNPYRPPSSDVSGPSATAASFVGGDFTLARCFSEAWAATWSSVGIWLSAGLVLVTIATVAAFTLVGILLLLPVLFWGTCLLSLNLVRGGAEFGDIFGGFANYGRVLGTMLIIVGLTFLISLGTNMLSMLMVASGSATVAWVGQLFALALAVYLNLRVYFAPLIAVDQNLGGWQAVVASWRLTEGRILKLCGLALIVAAVGVVGLLLLVLGIVPAVVIGYLMFTSAYLQLRGPPRSQL